MNFRRAVPADLPALLAIAPDVASNMPDGLTFEPRRLAQSLHALMAHPDGLVLIHEDGEGLAGVLVAVASDHLLAAERIASELIWWLDPRARGFRTASKLIGIYEAWARSRGCTRIALAATAAADDRLAAFYTRRGYGYAETHFMRTA